MGKCSLCPKSQSKLHPDGLCKSCHEKKLYPEGKTDTLFGLSEEQLEDLPELPSNWVSEPFHNLTGGHLLNIIMHANNILLTKIDEINDSVRDIKMELAANKATGQKNTESILANMERIERQENETNTMKKVIVNQQLFLERNQRERLASNLMITGIAKDGITIGGKILNETSEKVTALLHHIKAPVDQQQYTMHEFEGNSENTTIAVKLTFTDIETKKKVLGNAKLLKNSKEFPGVYIRNDETKISRKENFRLRDKARNLKSQHSESEVKIVKGKLLHDGVEVDKFDISNQIFA